MANRIEFDKGYKLTYDQKGKLLKKEKWSYEAERAKKTKETSASTKPSTNKSTASDMRSKTAERTKGQSYKAGQGFTTRNYNSKTYNLEKNKEENNVLSDQSFMDAQIEAARKEAQWQGFSTQVLNDSEYESSAEGQAHLKRLENYDVSKPSGKVKTYDITDEDEKKAEDKTLIQYEKEYKKELRKDPYSQKTRQAAENYNNAYFDFSGNTAKNYLDMEKDAIEKSKLAVTFEEQEYYEAQAKAYRERYNQYRLQAQYDENILKTEHYYANDAKKDSYILIGKQNDTFLDKTEEESKNTQSKALAGSLNEDDTLKAAAIAMSEEEKKKYYYVLGKDGQEAARSYLKALYDTSDLGERYAAEHVKRMEAVEKEVGTGSRGTYDVGMGFLEGLTGVGESFQGIGLAWKEAAVGEVHYNELVSERLMTKVLNAESQTTKNWSIDMARSVGQMMPAIVVSVATCGAGAPAMVATVAATGTTFATVYGKTYIDTRRDGYDAKDSAAYAAATATLESSLQFALSGVNVVSGGVLTKGLSKAAGKAVSKLVSHPVASKAFNYLVTSGINSAGEFTEEYIQAVLEPMTRNAILNENNEIDIFDEQNFLQGGIGALTAFLFNAPATVTGVRQYMTNVQKYGGAVNGADLSAMVTNGLNAPKTTDAYKSAKYISENYTKDEISNGNVDDTLKGVMLQEAAMQEQMQTDIAYFINGQRSWNDLTDVQRSILVDRNNVQYLNETFNLNLSEEMTPNEIKEALLSNFRINRDINTSTSEIQEYINGTKKWSELSVSTKRTLTDPKNADVLAKRTGININSEMTQYEMLKAIDDAAKDIRTQNRIAEEGLTESEIAQRNAQEMQELSLEENAIAERYENELELEVESMQAKKNLQDSVSEMRRLIKDKAIKEWLSVAESFQRELRDSGEEYLKSQSKDLRETVRELKKPIKAKDINAAKEWMAFAEKYQKEVIKSEESVLNSHYKDLRDSVRELRKSINEKDVEMAKEWLPVIEEYQREAISLEEEYLKTQFKNKEEKAKALRLKREAHKKYADSMRKLLSREDGKTKTLENKLFAELKKLKANQKSETGFKYKQEALNVLRELTSKKKAFKVKDFEKANAITEAYENFKAKYPDAHKNIQKPFVDFISEVNKKTVSELNTDELKTYYNLVKHLNHLQKTENRLIVHDKEIELKEMTQKVIDDTLAAPKHSGNIIAQVFTIKSLSPTTFLKTLEGHTGKSWSMFVDDFNNAFVKQETLKHEIYDEFNNATKNIKRKDLAKLFGDKAELKDTGIVVTDKNGVAHDLKLTTGERIALYMNTENDENMRHILGPQKLENGEIDYNGEGGIVVPERGFLKKGKRKRAESAGTTYRLTPENIEAFKKTITPEEMEFVEMFKRVYKRCQEAINEVSVQDVGYEIANIENYYPIRHGSKYVVGDYMFDIETVTQDKYGMLKARSEMSTSPIMLTDALTTMFNHANQVSNYYGMNIPLKNFQKILKQEGVRGSIEAQFGYSDAPIKYIEKFSQDLGITHKEIKTLDIIRGNFAKAALGLNPSVALSQMSAYPAAAIVLSNKSMVKGLSINCHTKSKIETIRRFSPLYRTREAGHTDIDISAISDLNKSKMKLNSNWIVQMDLFTVRQLWGACEMEVRNNSPELKVGTTAYYEEVARLHTQVIQRTQVNTSTMQTNAFQRSEIGKMAFMFRSESFKNFNILFDAYSKMRAVYSRFKNGQATKAELKQARKEVVTATTSQVASAASFAGVKALVGAFLDSDWEEEDEAEKTFIEKFGEKFGEKFLYNFTNSFAGNFVGGSEAIAATSKMTGFGFEHEAIQIPAIDNINNTVDAVVSLFSTVPKMATGEAKHNEVYSAIKNFAKMFGNFIGVPVGSIEKYTTNAIGLFNPEFKVWYEDLNYGTELKDLRQASSEEAPYAVRTLLESTSPVVAETEAGNEIATLAEKHRNDKDFDLGGAFIPNITGATHNGEEIDFTTEQKHKASDIANERYSLYANQLINSEAYKKLDDKDKYAALSMLVDLAVTEGKNEILKESGRRVEDFKLSEVYIGDYAAYKVSSKGETKERDQINTLLELDISPKAKRSIYEYEFEKFSELMNSATKEGLSVDEVIAAQSAMKYIGETSRNEKADKLKWIIENSTDEKELSTYYKHFVQSNKSVDYHKSIEYAQKQGVRPEAFIKREAELYDLSLDKVYSQDSDLLWQYGGLSNQNSISSSSQANKQNKADLLINGDYTEEEIMYFWQKEYPDDDDFPIAIAIGLSPTEYVKYYSKTKSNTKKADATLSLQSLNLTQAQQDIMMVFANSSWKIPSERRRAVAEVVYGADLPFDVKLQLTDKLKMTLYEDGRVGY